MMRPPMKATLSIASLRSGTMVFHAGFPGAPSTGGHAPRGWVRSCRCGRTAWTRSCRTAGIRRRPTRRAHAPARSTFGAFGFAEVGVVEPVLVVGPLEHQDEEVAAVLGHAAVDDPLRQVLALVDEHVLRLRRADAVVVERVVGQRRLEHLVPRRLRIARVEEPLAVLGPRDVREAHPAHLVGQILPRGHVAHLHRAPVGAAFRQAVGEERPVGRGRPLPHRHRAVLGDDVGVEHDRRLGRERARAGRPAPAAAVRSCANRTGRPCPPRRAGRRADSSRAR